MHIVIYHSNYFIIIIAINMVCIHGINVSIMALPSEILTMVLSQYFLYGCLLSF